MTQRTTRQTASGRDCLVIGGGPTGLLTALGLAHRGWSVELWERNAITTTVQKAKTNGERGSKGWGVFLTKATMTCLAKIIGSAPTLPMAAVHRFTLADAASGRSATLDPDVFTGSNITSGETAPIGDDEPNAFGWGIDTQDLRHALLQRVEAMAATAADSETRGLTLRGGMTIQRVVCTGQACLVISESGEQLRTRCLIVADGRDSQTRSLCGIAARLRPFGQSALLVRFAHVATEPNIGHGFELYTQGGPAVFLPMPGGTSTLTWVGPPSKMEELAQLSAGELKPLIAHLMPDWMGNITDIEQNMLKPLQHVLCPSPVSGRCVAVGDAANGLHPLFAQGFNLAVRDIAALCDHIGKKSESHPCDPGADLAGFCRARRTDQARSQLLTTLANEGLSAMDPIGALNRTLIPTALARSEFLRSQAIAALGGPRR